MTMRRVNRIALDGTTVNITIGRHLIACISASYGDKLETETLTPMGFQTIEERTRGTYKTEDAKIKMSAVTFRAELAPLLPKEGYGVVPIPIVIGYSHPDLGSDSDLLARARFSGIAQAVENSAKVLEVEFGLIFDQLYLTDRRITLNVLNPNVPIPLSKL